MKWKAPSERAQQWLAMPIVIPLAIISLPIFFTLLGVVKIEEWLRPSDDWHPWFAWRPVPLDHWSDHVGKRGGWAWLETVERRARPYNWPTEYRARADTRR